MRAMSKREARLVAALMLIVAVVVGDLALVQPLISGFADRAQARTLLRAKYAANERLIAAVPRLLREADRRDTALTRYAMPAKDAGTASEALRQSIQSATSVVGGDFRASEDVPAAPGVAATRASVRVTTVQLAKFLATLENGRPQITVTALSVGTDEALVTDRATDLDVQIDCTLSYRAPHAR